MLAEIFVETKTLKKFRNIIGLTADLIKKQKLMIVFEEKVGIERTLFTLASFGILNLAVSRKFHTFRFYTNEEVGNISVMENIQLALRPKL